MSDRLKHTTSDETPRALVIAAAAGAAVAISLGTYGKVHTGTGDTIPMLWFPTLLSMKSWMATVAVVLAAGQLMSALWLWGRLPAAGEAPPWVPGTHRWLGTAAFLFTLPVAYHCLWSLGFRTTDARVVVHSILGCAFYGAFTTKMLVLHSDRVPRWALPAAGGLLVSLLVGVWLVSSLWFFTNVTFPGL